MRLDNELGIFKWDLKAKIVTGTGFDPSAFQFKSSRPAYFPIGSGGDILSLQLGPQMKACTAGNLVAISKATILVTCDQTQSFVFCRLSITLPTKT